MQEPIQSLEDVEDKRVEHIEDSQLDPETDAQDLKRQLQLCKNTIHNQDTTLKIRTAELYNLSKENKELRLNVKQYESQIQMDGKVYKLVR